MASSRLGKGTQLLLLGILLVVIDQVVKVLVKTHMTLGESIPVLGDWFQLLFAAAMVILAIILVIEGIQTFASQAKKKA